MEIAGGVCDAGAVEIACLAHLTDLMFHRFDGQVVDRGYYIVIRTPTNPGYYSGNGLLFPRAPEPGDAARWLALFEAELPGAPHRMLAWDGDLAGDTTELAALGFDVHDNAVLATTGAPERRRAEGVVVRPVVGDQDWAAVRALNAACDERVGSSQAYDDYSDRLYARLRAMSEAGLGHWLGAFVGPRLVGQLGIYADGDLARYNSVETHPELRRRGICSALVTDAAHRALGELGARTVVIVANADSDAERLYRRLGFAEVGREHLAVRPPPQSATG